MNNTLYQPDQRSDIVHLLRSHLISPTMQRVLIASKILERPQHLSANQVLELTRESGRKVSKATVYNTLGLFVRKGLVRELIIDSSSAFYDSNTAPHAHLYDPDRRELRDLDLNDMQIYLPKNLPADTRIDRIEVTVHLASSKAG